MKKTEKGRPVKVRLCRSGLKSADKAPYLGRVVMNGEAHLDDILQAVAKETGGTVAQARLAYDAMLEVLLDKLRQGCRVATPLGVFEPAISGTVPHADSPLDPKRNRIYVKVTPPPSFRKELAKLTPVVVGGPVSALRIGEVFTGALGARGYNVVLSGESFVLTGDGFQENGELSVTLTDANGQAHAVTVEARKKTALVCSLDEPAAKGAARLDVVLAAEAPDVCRFTASRKVTVR